MAADTTYQPTGLQRRQDGTTAIPTGGSLDIESGGVLKIAGTTVTPTAAELNVLAGVTTKRINSVGFAAAAGATNESIVTCTIKDVTGAAIAEVRNLELWLSDATTGIGLTGTTASGATVAGSAGTVLTAWTAKKHLRVQTDATGVFKLSITDTAKTGFYVAAASGDGKPSVSAQLVTGNYG